MGSPDTEWGRFHSEGPQLRVTIPEAFAAGVYEVTFEEWDACVNEGGCNGYRPQWRGLGTGRSPCDQRQLGRCPGVRRLAVGSGTGKPYRLLSEAEWEYVARAGTLEPFHTGATISAEQANYDSSYTYGAGEKKWPLSGSHGARGDLFGKRLRTA